MSNDSFQLNISAISLVALFLALPILGIATSGVNAVPEGLEPPAEPRYTHSSSSMNEPGFQSGSIFTYESMDASTTEVTSCAINDNGSLLCWGWNGEGQLGNGNPNQQYTPTSVYLGPGRRAVAVSTGDHTCAILDDGSLMCWGANNYGQLGVGNVSTSIGTPVPVALGTGRTAVTVTTGEDHTCAILDNASLKCWGRNSNGQLGIGSTTSEFSTPQWVDLGTDRTAVAASAGAYHTCAILDDASLKCWGHNGYGRLGISSSTDQISPQTVDLGTDRTAAAVALGNMHTCAIMDNASLKCWGRNNYGQLGTSITSHTNIPQLIELGNGHDAVSISLGHWHTCAILDNASLKCWGFGGWGELGIGSTTGHNTPQYVDLGTGRTAVAVSAGYDFTCAILDNASLNCWGNNGNGQLGIGDTTGYPQQTTPAWVDIGAGRHMDLSERDMDGDGVLNIFDTHMPGGQEDSIHMDSTLAAGGSHTCVLLVNGSVACWGDNDYGQLGDGTTTDSSTPVNVSLPSGRTATAISAGRWHTCAIMDNGSLMCWGKGNDGQIGDGAATQRSTPSYVSLPSGRTAEAVTGGRWHTCAILDDGSLWCWGHNNQGQLGDGTYTSRATPFNSVLPSGLTAVSIAAGYTHTCAILDDGSVRCWGGNSYGQRGIGSSGGFSNTPASSGSITLIPSGMSAVAIAIEDAHTCAILNDGSVWCWGYNMEGQIGNGYSGSSLWNALSPVQVNLPSGRTADLLTAGRHHTCVVLAPNLADSGSTMCWGKHNPNNSGMGGIGFTASNTPVYANITQNVVALRGSNEHTCYVLSNNSVNCAGTSSQGATPTGHISFTLQGSGPEMGDTDKDGDGVSDLFDGFLNNPIRGRSCPAGSYGRYLCEDASEGHYVASAGSMQQTECSAGTYQPLTGQSSCLDASAGSYVSSTGATSQTACPAGTYNPSTGGNSSAACLTTPAGFYSGAGAGSPIPCDAGTYQPNSGSTSGACLDASAGYYVPITGVIYASYHHTCAIDHLGELYCWGANENGILGQNDSGEASDQNALHNSNTPLNVSFSPGRTAVSVSMGYSHTCAILDNGSVNCWGSGSHTGTGSVSYIPIYTPLGTGRTAIAIDSGQLHTCAILDDGSLKCWGYNNNGQIANNSAVYYHSNPVDVYLGAGRTAANISLGDFHTCVILDDSSLKCWGENIYGQLGDGTTTDTCTDDYDDQGNPLFTCENNASTASAIDLGTGRYAVAVSAAKQHTCAILDDGSMKCWGANGNGKLGDGTATQRLTPVAVSLSSSFTASKVSAGGSHTCAIMSDDSLWCWGYGDYIGVGEYACEDWDTGANDLCYTPVWLNLSAKAVNLGNEHTCAILDDANFWCWGRNSEYQLGTSNSGSEDWYTAYLPEQTLMPTMAYGASSQTACPAGTYNPNTGSTTSAACLDTDAGYYTGSAGSASQTACAAGTYQPNTGQSSCIDASAGYYVPSTTSTSQTACAAGTYQPSTGQSSCIDASAGYYVPSTASISQTTCAAGTYQPNTGQTSCIDASAGHYATNLPYANISASGSEFSCFLENQGSVYCWGSNSYGKLGDGTTTDRITPTEVVELPSDNPATGLSLGSNHACVVLADGSVYCWGGNDNGELGDGSTIEFSSTPVQVNLPNGTNARQIDVSEYHSCAILNNGAVFCWGWDLYSVLGDGNDADALVDLPANLVAVDLALGSDSSCVLADVDTNDDSIGDGTSPSIYCWGTNTAGQLGNGNTTSSGVPVQVSLPSGAIPTALSMGYAQHSMCALMNQGSAYCWGSGNEGQLGDGNTSTSSTPVEVTILSNTSISQISVGSHHACAILTNNSIYCWGYNAAGQLGNTTPNVINPTPVLVGIPAGLTANSISSASEHNCAVLNDLSVYCWGGNDEGQLGDGTYNDSSTPVQVDVQYISVSITIQYPCSLGTYQNQSGQASCIDAPVGTFVNSTAATSPTDCAVGTFQNQTGQTSCIDALPGTYVDTTGASSPTDCTGGTYQPSSGQTSCLDADAGYYVGSTGASAQTPCSLGTYQPYTGQASCISASAGHYVDTTASANQTACAAGTYQPNTGQSSCIDASAGYYVASTASTGQTPCAAGTYQPNTGQSSCLDAPTGTYVDTTGATSSTDCPVGTYQPNTGQSTCIDAGAGYFVDETGSTNQTACDLGTFQNQTGQSACIDAPAGTFVNTTAATSPTDCLVGTYQPNTGQTSCIDTPAGTYVDTTGATTPTDCPVGTYQPDVGQTSCIDADAGYYVPNPGSTNQTACSFGNYQPSTGQSSCIDASPGYYVAVNASTVQVPCSPGTYQPNSGQSSCIDADAGYYVPNSGSTNQTACYPGTYQELTGQTGCTDAHAGYFVNTTAATYPTPCPPGSYQPLTGQTSCLLASPGYYVDTTGSDVQTPCPAGTYNPQNGSSTQADCVEADIGYHVPYEGSANQSECLAGTFQNVTGQSSCIPAEPGYYVPSNASWFQVGCTAGTYQPNYGQVSCTDASPGYHVPNHASASQTECSLGSYQPSSGQTSCILASIGYYVDFLGSTNQTACPSGTSTTSTGSISINECYIDTDDDGVPDITDPDDDNDGYLDYVDDFPLDPDEWIDTDGDGIGNNADTDDDADGWDDATELACGNSDPLNATSTPADYDGDGTCDTQDTDDDNDSYEDTVDAFPLDECAAVDTDMDGMPDWIFFNCVTNLTEDMDDDDDGYDDANDSFPQDPFEWFDTDMDGIGNNADTDDDGDSVPDEFDAFPLDPDEWEDTDGDGIGDNADPDNDGDGVLDGDDDFPNDANETTDTDGDGIGNNADTDDDGDGVLDIYDAFPLDSTEWEDTDSDGIGNNADSDDDNDGWSDSDEFICGTDPLDDNDIPPDSDGDGICDSEDETGLGLMISIVTENPLYLILILAIVGIVVIQFFSRSEKPDVDLISVEDQFEDDDESILEDEDLTDQF